MSSIVKNRVIQLNEANFAQEVLGAASPVRVLKIHAPDQDNERPTPVEIKFIRCHWHEHEDSSAVVNRGRSGQRRNETAR
jgi:hypothetical protein